MTLFICNSSQNFSSSRAETDVLLSTSQEDSENPAANGAMVDQPRKNKDKTHTAVITVPFTCPSSNTLAVPIMAPAPCDRLGFFSLSGFGMHANVTWCREPEILTA